MDKKWIFEGEEICTESGIRINLNEGKLKVISADLKEVVYFDKEGKFATKLPYKTEEQRSSENKQRVFNNFFCHMTKERIEQVRNFFKDIKPTTGEMYDFICKLNKALREINYDYWISTIEPVIKDEKLVFARGEECSEEFSVNKWMEKVLAFAPEFHSNIATENELILFYAYRVAINKWSLYYICNDSSSEGNYEDSKFHSGKCDLTAAKKVGGFNDGIGNTRKLVTYDNLEYCLYGGSWKTSGKAEPVFSREIIWCNVWSYSQNVINATPVVVCTEVKGDLIIQ